MRALAVALALLPPPPGVGLAFPDPVHGWAAGGGGIVATVDGGRTWRLQTRTPAAALAAVDTKHAWALTRASAIERTTDGRTWRRLRAPRLAAFSFVSPTLGFALRRDGIALRTRDGGATWAQLGAPTRAQSLCFGDAGHGWLARGGTVWQTGNGGASWRRTRLLRDRQGFPIPDLACRGKAAWLTFHGGAAAGSEGYIVFRSRRQSWRAVYAQFMRPGLPRVDAYVGPIAVVAGAAVVEGSCGPCGRGTVSVRRPDGRRSVLRAYLPGPIAFADRRHGYLLLGSAIAPRRGVVLATRDSGRTWRRVYASRRLAPA